MDMTAEIVRCTRKASHVAGLLCGYFGSYMPGALLLRSQDNRHHSRFSTTTVCSEGLDRKSTGRLAIGGCGAVPAPSAKAISP